MCYNQQCGEDRAPGEPINRIPLIPPGRAFARAFPGRVVMGNRSSRIFSPILIILLFQLLFIAWPLTAGAATPPAWDWRDVDGVNYVSGVRNQGSCGSQYIFAPVAVVESRYMIARDISSDVDFSEQYIMACGTGYFGDFDCNGGYCKDVFTHIRDVGVPLESCYLYKAVDESCPTDCPDSSLPLELFQVVDQIGEYLNFLDEELLKEEIYTNGPVAVTFDVYDDLYSYTTGIYQHVAGSLIGGTAVAIVGWGDDLGTPYWIVKNAWGPAWGEGGYFRVLRDSLHANCEFGKWVWTCTVNTGESPVVDLPPPAESLAQNHPNPFNPSTTITYTPVVDGPLTLTVFDAMGSLIRTLVNGEGTAGREYRVVWNGRDTLGRQVTSGVYFYRLDTGPSHETKRMVLLR